MKGQRGFTLIELLAVMGILTVLAGLVAGSVVGLGASGQNARLVGDADTIGKAADWFFTEAFPQAYPVLRCCKFVGDAAGTAAANTDATPGDILEAGDLGVRLINFGAVLPGNPTKSFVPDFLKEVPDTAALVSWRIDTRNGRVFFAQDGAQLVQPSTARLDVSAVGADGVTTNASTLTGEQSDYTIKLRMNKNEAALAILGIAIPAKYSIGGQSVARGDLMGTLTGKLSTDNPWDPGQVLGITGTLKATGQSNEWLLYVNYLPKVNAPTSSSIAARCDRSHKVSIVTPSEEVAGAMKIEMATRCDSTDDGIAPPPTEPLTGDKAHNQGTETWELTICGKSGCTPGGTNVITNPSLKGVYRWLATQHTTIDVGANGQELFSRVSGNQAVVIKESPTATLPSPTAVPTPTPTPTPAPAPVAALPFSTTGDLYILDQGSKNVLRITPTGSVSIAITQAQIKAATQLTSVSLFNRGIAFDGAGTLYFTESASGSILRRPLGGTLTVLTPNAVIVAAAGGAGDPRAIAFGSDGFLYVNDDSSDSVLRVNPVTGAVSVYVSKATFTALAGVTVNLAGGIVGDALGNVYVASAPATGPHAVLKIAAGGLPSVLASGTTFSDLDVFITRAANGDLMVADDFGADTVRRVTPAGVVSTFLSKKVFKKRLVLPMGNSGDSLKLGA